MCFFMCSAQVKPSNHKGKKEKLPADLLMVAEPLHGPLHLHCVLCVPQFHQQYQTFQSPGSKEVIVSLRTHNQ